MTNTGTMSPALQSETGTAVHLLDNWFDAIEVGVRERVREFIQAMIESELETALARPRYGRRPMTDPENADDPSGISGYRHGHRSRSLMLPIEGYADSRRREVLSFPQHKEAAALPPAESRSAARLVVPSGMWLELTMA